MKFTSLVIFLLLTTICSFGQTTIYLEGFDGQTNKGATGSTPTVDLTGVDWNIDFSSANLSNQYRFRVANISGNQRFEGRNVGASSWLSPIIDISNYTDVEFTIEASQGANNLDNSDIVTTDYRIDGGTWTNASINGVLSNDYGNVTIRTSGLIGSTIELRVIMANNNNNERQRIDNIEVTGILFVACPEITDLEIDGFTNDSATISWIAGGSESSWEIAIQADGTGEPTSNGSIVTAPPPYTVTNLIPATAYEVYVRANCGIDGFSNWAGPIDFTTPIENDDLANAISISCGNTYLGDTSLATLDEIGAPDISTIEIDTPADNDSPNVWYSFIGTGDTITLSTCANTNFDSEILVFTGTSGNLTLIDDGYDECNNITYEAETTFNSILGTQYLISVEGWNVGDTGAFELAVGCFPSTIENDDLANATPISCGNTYLGNTIIATIDEIGAPNIATVEADTPADNDSPNVWYSFIGNGDTVTLSTCANTSFDSEILVFTGTSGNLTLIDDGYDECSNITYEAETTFTSIFGTQYYISVEGWNLTDTGTFELTVSCVSPPSITYIYNGTWSPSDPNGVATVSDNIIIASSDAVINANTICNTVTVNPGASLTINTGIELTVTTDVTLESVSDSYSSLIHNGMVIGTIKYERYVNANSGGNDLISPPLLGQTWTDFLNSDTNATDLLNDGNSSPTTYLFGPFDKSTNSYVNYLDTTSASLISGTGYRAGTISGTTLTFTGSVLTTSITVNIVDTGVNFPDWNLIGNPYPSYINIADFLNYETSPGIRNIDILEDISGIYAYDGDASNGWNVITLANAGTKLMAPGQGFFVAADDADVDAYDITFDPIITSPGNTDDFILGRDANVLTFLKLKANTTNKEYATEFYFNPNASLGLDPGYDGKILGNIAPNFAIYSHLVQDNSGLPIALQALNPSDLSNTLIPLGVNSYIGEQITFSISEINLPSTVNVYLEDNVENTSTLLNINDYTITPNNDLIGTGRFYLRVTDGLLSTPVNSFDNLNIYPNYINKTIEIAGELFDITTANIYDIHGRVVTTSILKMAHRSQTIDVSNLNTGVYIIQLLNGAQSKTQKLIIH